MKFRTEIFVLFDAYSANCYSESIHHSNKYMITDHTKHMYYSKITRMEAGSASNIQDLFMFPKITLVFRKALRSFIFLILSRTGKSSIQPTLWQFLTALA